MFEAELVVMAGECRGRPRDTALTAALTEDHFTDSTTWAIFHAIRAWRAATGLAWPFQREIEAKLPPTTPKWWRDRLGSALRGLSTVGADAAAAVNQLRAAAERRAFERRLIDIDDSDRTGLLALCSETSGGVRVNG